MYIDLRSLASQAHASFNFLIPSLNKNERLACEAIGGLMIVCRNLSFYLIGTCVIVCMIEPRSLCLSALVWSLGGTCRKSLSPVCYACTLDTIPYRYLLKYLSVIHYS